MRLSEEQRREAVALLADLLLEAARKRASASGAALDGVNGGASGGVDEFPDRRGRRPLRVMRPIGDVDIRGSKHSARSQTKSASGSQSDSSACSRNGRSSSKRTTRKQSRSTSFGRSRSASASHLVKSTSGSLPRSGRTGSLKGLWSRSSLSSRTAQGGTSRLAPSYAAR